MSGRRATKLLAAGQFKNCSMCLTNDHNMDECKFASKELAIVRSKLPKPVGKPSQKPRREGQAQHQLHWQFSIQPSRRQAKEFMVRGNSTSCPATAAAGAPISVGICSPWRRKPKSVIGDGMGVRHRGRCNLSISAVVEGPVGPDE